MDGGCPSPIARPEPYAAIVAIDGGIARQEAAFEHTRKLPCLECGVQEVCHQSWVQRQWATSEGGLRWICRLRRLVLEELIAAMKPKDLLEGSQERLMAYWSPQSGITYEAGES